MGDRWDAEVSADEADEADAWDDLLGSSADESGGVSGSTRGRRSRAGPEAPPRSRHGSSFVSPFLVRLARRTVTSNPVAVGRVGDVGPGEGAGLAPPHPGHEQQPRSRRRGGRARGATWSDSTPRPRPPPAGATGRWRGRPRGLWPRRGGPGHVRARRRSAGSPAGLGSPGEPGPEVGRLDGRSPRWAGARPVVVELGEVLVVEPAAVEAAERAGVRPACVRADRGLDESAVGRRRAPRARPAGRTADALRGRRTAAP